jgi:hypothetical protein
MTQTVNSVLRRYAAGKISALKAAALLGDRVTVGDVFVMLLQAGLQPSRPSQQRERAELEHARHVLGLVD